MRLSYTLRWLLLFAAYALTVWETAYQGLQGSDVLGLTCVVLLLGGVVMLVYVGFLRRTVQPRLFSTVAAITLALLGLGLGTMTSGETGFGIAAGLLIGGTVIVTAVAVRRRRRPKTLFISYRRADSGDITPRIRDRLAQRFGDKIIIWCASRSKRPYEAGRSWSYQSRSRVRISPSRLRSLKASGTSRHVMAAWCGTHRSSTPTWPD